MKEPPTFQELVADIFLEETANVIYISPRQEMHSTIHLES